MKKVAILLLVSLSLGGCSSWLHSSQPAAAAQGGIGGAVLGAGTGAAVGSLISGGEVGPSALVGAGVGLVVGSAGALVYQHQVRETIVDANNQEIQRLDYRLRKGEQQRESLRKELSEQSDPVQDVSRTEQLPFQGVTTGKAF